MVEQNNSRFNDMMVLIKGAGDLASGVAYRLKRGGFPLLMTELAEPMLVRRTICFSKTERMHELVIGLFVNRYEFGRVI